MSLPTNEEFIAAATETAERTAGKVGLQIVRVYAAPNGTTVTFNFNPYGYIACPYYSLDYQQHLDSIHIVGINLDDDLRGEVFNQCYYLARRLGVGKLNVLDPSPELEACAIERGYVENPDQSMPHYKWYTLEIK